MATLTWGPSRRGPVTEQGLLQGLLQGFTPVMVYRAIKRLVTWVHAL